MCEYKLLDNVGYMSIYLIKRKVENERFKVHFRAQLKDVANCMPVDEKYYLDGSTWGWPKFIEIEKLFLPSMNYIDEDLSITFVIEVGKLKLT